MIPGILNRILSLGIKENMEPSRVNRIRRINLYFLVLLAMLTISLVWSIVVDQNQQVALNSLSLVATVAVYILFPAAKKPNLSSLLVLTLTAVILLAGFIFNMGTSSSMVLAFYLLFPLAAVAMNARKGILVPIALGMVSLTANFMPAPESYIHMELYDALVFFSIYALVIIIAIFVERSNRKLLDQLISSRKQAESEIIQKDEFISRLSHKMRTSLSNITLVNNLVHDSRLTSEQKELMETLKASTNNLIEDVNNIVEIASPGILDYKKSILPFDLSRVLDEAINILNSSSSVHEEVSVNRFDKVEHYLIGDPSLLRSLVVNIVKGLGLYKNTDKPIELIIENLRENPGQVRLEFKFRAETDLGTDLVEYVQSMKGNSSQQVSNLGNAFSLLMESESELSAVTVGRLASISFFQDFAKDPTRSVVLPQEAAEKELARRRKTALKDAKVLLVEDNQINQKIVLLSISKQVARIDVAGNGKEALEMFGLKQYDLILMDIMMPVMDGIVATKKIREIESTGDSHVPIIAITANALAGDRENCLAAGADDYIAKPFAADVLVRMMKNLLA